MQNEQPQGKSKYAVTFFDFFLLTSSFLLHPLNQMVSHPERISHNRERWVYRAARAENAAVHNVEIVHVMRFAVNVQRAGLRVVAEANRADLVGDPCQRDALANE